MPSPFNTKKSHGDPTSLQNVLKAIKGTSKGKLQYPQCIEKKVNIYKIFK